VNAGVNTLGSRPPEYWLLGTLPEAWRAPEAAVAIVSGQNPLRVGTR